jgi:hypothetical protein
MKKCLVQVFDFFTSLKLAVILIVSLGAVLAVGTFYEAQFGTAAAQRVIYKSWYVSLEMILLIINLSCSAIDRYPWKKHHAGFVLTHMGIITLILGSFITQQKGIDGNIALSLNESTDSLFVADTELHIYQSLDGRPFALLAQKSVDFDRHPPGKSNYEFKLADDDVLRVTKYIEKAIRQMDVSPSHDTKSLAAVKFSLSNDRVNVSEWLGLDGQLPPFYDLGPASVSFIKGPLPIIPKPRNQIVIQQLDDDKFNYYIYSSRQLQPVQQGAVQVGKDNTTGWMNIIFKVEQILPHAEVHSSFNEASGDAPNSTPAIEVDVNGHKGWFELESPHEIKGDHTSYFVSFTKKKYELGFVLGLKKFKMGIYGGSNLPSSYESTVLVDNNHEQIISMNEPLKFHDYTIYQSSFETNDQGEPTTSIFSVNYDPGRPIKYAGALCIVAGIGVMFYWKPKYTGKKKHKVREIDGEGIT